MMEVETYKKGVMHEGKCRVEEPRPLLIGDVEGFCKATSLVDDVHPAG